MANILNNYSASLKIETKVIGRRADRRESITSLSIDNITLPGSPPPDLKQVVSFGGNNLNYIQFRMKRGRRGESVKFYKEYTQEKDFTVKDIFNCIADFETEARAMKQFYCFGNIDVEHTYFEGIVYNEEDKSYSIRWGS